MFKKKTIINQYTQMCKTQPQVVSMYVLSVLSVLGFSISLVVISCHYNAHKDNVCSSTINVTWILDNPFIIRKQEAQDIFFYYKSSQFSRTPTILHQLVTTTTTAATTSSSWYGLSNQSIAESAHTRQNSYCHL